MDRYSAEMRLLQLTMYFYTALRRRLLCVHTTPPMPAPELGEFVQLNVNKWYSKAKPFIINRLGLLATLKDIPSPLDVEELSADDMHVLLDPELLQSWTKTLRRRLHGRCRTQLRRLVCKRTNMLEELRQQRKIGKIG